MSKLVFNNITELENHIKAMELRRKIDVEKLKYLKNQLSSDLKPYKFIGTGVKIFQRYGLMYLIKKLLK